MGVGCVPRSATLIKFQTKDVKKTARELRRTRRRSSFVGRPRGARRKLHGVECFETDESCA